LGVCNRFGPNASDFFDLTWRVFQKKKKIENHIPKADTDKGFKNIENVTVTMLHLQHT
jgi:hypothetical protein